MIRYNRRNLREVTLGEILASVFIALVMIIIGVLISLNIVSAIEKDNEKYQSILQLSSDEQELFKYSMDTNVGNALVNGEFEVVEGVRVDELQQPYMVIERVKERYTKHSRTETYTDSKGKTKTKTVHYETWDYVSRDTNFCNQVNFMGNIFNAQKFNFSNYVQRLGLDSSNVSSQYNDKISGNYLYKNSKNLWIVGDIRYYYEVVPLKLSGTVFANLKDKDIFPAEGSSITVYNMSIDEFLEYNNGKTVVFNVIFWIFWIVVIGAVIFIFIIQRNKWADIEL